MRTGRAVATVLVLLAGASSVAAAQTDPRLVAAVRAAQEGQGDSARASIQRLLDATAPTDSLYPQILYTQAMVADNAGDMRRALQRVAVEYPTSDWSDDALMRLVQMDYATRSFDAAARNLERLRQDFPAHSAVRAGRLLGGPDVLRPQEPRARLRVAGRRNGPRAATTSSCRTSSATCISAAA